MSDDERTCWNCRHSKLCYVRRGVMCATNTASFLNIDGDSAPGQWRDIFATLASACSKYELDGEVTLDNEQICRACKVAAATGDDGLCDGCRAAPHLDESEDTVIKEARMEELQLCTIMDPLLKICSLVTLAVIALLLVVAHCGRDAEAQATPPAPLCPTPPNPVTVTGFEASSPAEYGRSDAASQLYAFAFGVVFTVVALLVAAWWWLWGRKQG